MAWFNKSPKVWETQITEGGGPISSPKINRGKYDHRKAQRGQNSYGGGGRRVHSAVDEVTRVDVPEIEDRINAFTSRPKMTPIHAVEAVGFFAIVGALIQKWRRSRM